MKHGGNLREAQLRFGGETEAWLDLSTGINPHPWGDGRLSERLVENDWNRLPSPADAADLNACAQAAYAASTALTFVAAPGTEALLSRLARLAPEGPAALVAPTYSGHREAWTEAGRPPREVAGVEAAGDATVVILVNPNNPDGRIVAPPTLLAFARTLAARGGLLIVDEAFADVAPHASLLPHVTDEPVAILRSFGKFFGLAGLRLGFLAAQPALARRVEASLGSWAVSGPAIAIGRAALADIPWQDAMRRQLAEETAALDAILAEAGLPIIGGTSLFRLIVHPRAQALHEALAQRHVWTRSFDYRADWLRIGLPGGPDARTRFAQALAAALDDIAP